MFRPDAFWGVILYPAIFILHIESSPPFLLLRCLMSSHNGLQAVVTLWNETHGLEWITTPARIRAKEQKPQRGFRKRASTWTGEEGPSLRSSEMLEPLLWHSVHGRSQTLFFFFCWTELLHYKVSKRAACLIIFLSVAEQIGASSRDIYEQLRTKASAFATYLRGAWWKHG